MGLPVEVARVHNGAAHGVGVAVQILGGGVGDDIRTELKGVAVGGGGEGVVHNEGHPIFVGHPGKLLNVQHHQGRVGDGLAEHGLGVGAEGGLELLLGAIGVHKGEVDAHALHGHRKQVISTAIDGGRGHHMVPGRGDVEHGEEGGRLTGGQEHGGGATLQLAQAGGHGVAGGVLQPGVEVPGGLQVKQLSHVLAGLITERGGLDDGNVAGFSVSGPISGVETAGIKFHGNASFLNSGVIFVILA